MQGKVDVGWVRLAGKVFGRASPRCQKPPAGKGTNPFHPRFAPAGEINNLHGKARLEV